MTGFKRFGHGFNTVKLAEHLAFSPAFKNLFADGMRLVEECAEYLDGPGRFAAKQLSRSSSLLYGAESMRLTTRLMQLASWLLLQRAVSEGEMSREQVVEEKRKIKLDTLPTRIDGPGWEEIPDEFIHLVRRSVELQRLIARLDSEIYGAADERQEPANPVANQLSLLSAAFDKDHA